MRGSYVDTDLPVGPPTQEAAIEQAYAKYMAALATHYPRPGSPVTPETRDYLLVASAPRSAELAKSVK
jgi:hypothetical protein